jgi:hypothetical protein
VTRATSRQARDVFAVIDAMDVAALGSRFAENRRVTFGNSTPLLGVEEIHRGATLFSETVCGLHHTIVNQRHVDGETIVELNVTDDRKHRQQVTMPCVTIFHSIGDGKSDDYRVHLVEAPDHDGLAAGVAAVTASAGGVGLGAALPADGGWLAG